MHLVVASSFSEQSKLMSIKNAGQGNLTNEPFCYQSHVVTPLYCLDNPGFILSG